MKNDKWKYKSIIMIGIVFSTVTSIIPRIADSYTMKAAYILCDRVLALGVSGALLEMKKELKKVTVKSKIENLEKILFDAKNEIGYNYVLDVKHSMKQFSLLKHPTKEQIVANANMERNLLKYYDEVHSGNYNFYESIGFGDMSTLLEKDILDSHLMVMTVKPVPEDNSPNLALAAHLNIVLYPSGNPKDTLINFVTIDFLEDYHQLTPEVTKKEDITAEQLELIDSKVKLWSCIEIANLDRLSALELKALRGKLMKEGTAFKQKVNDFIQMNSENDKTTAELDSYFDDVFAPEAEKLQAIIDTSDIMCFKKITGSLDPFRFELNIGEASLDYWFAYLEKFSIVDLPTLNLVREEIKLHKDYPRFIPFVCVSNLYKNMDEMAMLMAKEIEDAELPLPRKFIPVDD